MDLVKNDGFAWLYIIPSVGKTEKAAAIERWNYPVRRFELRNYDYKGFSISKEIHVKQSTKGFPCSQMDEETYYEVRRDKCNINISWLLLHFIQCIGETMTEIYLKFPKKYCATNVSSPCWIPQADSIIHEYIMGSLPPCDTIEKYYCMLETIREAAGENFDQHCLKTCEAEVYKISTLEGQADTFQKVRDSFKITSHFSNGSWAQWLLFILHCFFRKGKHGEYMLSQNIKASLNLS